MPKQRKLPNQQPDWNTRIAQFSEILGAMAVASAAEAKGADLTAEEIEGVMGLGGLVGTRPRPWHGPRALRCSHAG
jgi:hypothetical protein